MTKNYFMTNFCLLSLNTMSEWERPLCNSLHWSVHQARALYRAIHNLVMMYKIVHGMVVIPTTPYFLPASYDTRGHSSKFLVPSTRVNAFRYSYFPATIMSWNGLQHTFYNHHQLNASNPGWQNFTLHLQVQCNALNRIPLNSISRLFG